MAANPVPTSMLDAALALASSGVAVFPVVPTAKNPYTKRGFKDATTDLVHVRKWWKRWPDAWIGSPTGGESRELVIDADVYKDDGAGLAALESKYGPLPKTFTVRSASGGRHFRLRYPEGRDFSRITCGANIGGIKFVDLRGNGGYVVIPPTPGYVIDVDAPVAELPPAWAEFLLKVEPPPPSVEPFRMHQPSSSGYAAAALKDACTRLAAMPKDSGRNHKLNKEAYSLAGFVASGALDESEVRNCLYEAAIASGLGENETRKSIASGFSKGLTRPRSVPERRFRVVSDPVAGDGTPRAEPTWREALRKNDKGQLTKDPTNALLLLVNHDTWRGRLGWCEFRDLVFWRQDAPRVPGLTAPRAGDAFIEPHFGYVQAALSYIHQIGFARGAVADTIETAARENRGHALRDWLSSLVWDGRERLYGWLTTYLAADRTVYHGEIGRWWLISAVARAFDPGCQVDHMLILEGAQGCGKSTAVQILAGDWYLGSVGDLRDKDAVQNLRGRWIVEFPELDAIRGAAITRVKDFITQRVDIYRPSYARLTIRRPRECAFVGTTNETHYLQDPTGARRYWPVRVTQLDRDTLAADRDQLWAEAVAAYRAGDPWSAPPAFAATLTEEQEARFEVDPWEELIAEWVTLKDDFTATDVALECLKIDRSKISRADQIRIGNCLRRLKFVSYRARRGGILCRPYTRAA